MEQENLENLENSEESSFTEGQYHTTDEENIVENENDQKDDESDEDQTNDQKDDESDEDETTDSDENSDKKDSKELPEWVAKRLAQKDRQIKRQLKEKDKQLEQLQRQVEAIYKPFQQEDQEQQNLEGKILDPVTGQYVDETSVEGQVVKKIHQYKQVEKYQNIHQNFVSKENELREKYDDYDDVIDDSKKYLSKAMLETMVATPSVIEHFYSALKNNPETVKEISKMQPFEQIRALYRLEALNESKIQQKVKSDAPKPITPVKSSAKNIVDENSYQAMLQQERERQRRLFGDR